MLLQLVDQLASQLKMSGRERTALAYYSAVRSFRKKLGSDYSGDEMLSAELLCLYEKRLIATGASGNTISFYMRMLRAIYNKGALLGMYPSDIELFSHVYTGIDSTPKRAVSPDVFGLLQKLDLSSKPNLAFCRDLFLLSFSLQGISFVDLAYLRKSDLHNSILTYHRAKTGSQIKVAVSDFAMNIINKFAKWNSQSVYLLPIIKDPEGNVKLQYQSALRTHNRRLKKLAELADIADNLTSYVARHSWATTAREEDVPVSLISHAMGHKSEKVTYIYLADFDQSTLLLANERVLMAAQLINEDEMQWNKQKKAVMADREKNVRHLRSDGQISGTNV